MRWPEAGSACARLAAALSRGRRGDADAGRIRAAPNAVSGGRPIRPLPRCGIASAGILRRQSLGFSGGKSNNDTEKM